MAVSFPATKQRPSVGCTAHSHSIGSTASRIRTVTVGVGLREQNTLGRYLQILHRQQNQMAEMQYGKTAGNLGILQIPPDFDSPAS
jgi:hypothetical protein